MAADKQVTGHRGRPKEFESNVNALIAAELRAFIDREAARDGVPASAVVREMLAEARAARLAARRVGGRV